MPQVIIKLLAGRPARRKQVLADAVAKAVMMALHSDVDAVSVALEEIKFEVWNETVYRVDILGKRRRSISSRVIIRFKI
jgi:phenylpyruvate tautomerase PptA (4-oxalocrotonate tautomerase family)